MVEICKYFKTPGNGFNLAKLNDAGQQFKAKFLTLRMLKFDPLVINFTIVGWPKKSNNIYSFYQHKLPSQFLTLTNFNSRKSNLQMVEHAVIEVATERKARALAKNFTGKRELTGSFCMVVNQFSVTIDEKLFVTMRNPKAQHPPCMLDDPAIQPLQMQQFGMPMTPTN